MYKKELISRRISNDLQFYAAMKTKYATYNQHKI